MTSRGLVYSLRRMNIGMATCLAHINPKLQNHVHSSIYFTYVMFLFYKYCEPTLWCWYGCSQCHNDLWQARGLSRGGLMVRDGEHWSVVQSGWLTLPAAGNMPSCDPVAALTKCFLATSCSCGTKARAALRQLLGSIALQVAPVTHGILRLRWRKFFSIQEHNKLQPVQSRHRRLMGWKIWDPVRGETSWPPPIRAQTISHQEIISNI